jgi:hypothetical protein
MWRSALASTRDAPTCELSQDAGKYGEMMPNLPGTARDTGDVPGQMYTGWRRGAGERGGEQDLERRGTQLRARV